MFGLDTLALIGLLAGGTLGAATNKQNPLLGGLTGALLGAGTGGIIPALGATGTAASGAAAGLVPAAGASAAANPMLRMLIPMMLLNSGSSLLKGSGYGR